MSERKFGLKVTEGELIALIHHHTLIIKNTIEDDVAKPVIEVSERLHNLMKRLHNDKPEIEGDLRPSEAQEQVKAPAVEGWN